MMSSDTSSQTSPDLLTQVKRAALNRWKMESLTGLLGFRALQSHQSEQAKNVAAENRHVRKTVWGENDDQAGEEMGPTILGDNIHHPTPIVITGQQSGGLAKTLAGMAIGAMIPAAGVAGYAINKLLNPPDPPAATAPPAAAPATETESLDLGLLRFEDLKSSR